MDVHNKNLAALEALLFIHGDPIPVAKLDALLGLAAGEAKTLIERYRAALREDDRGLMLMADRSRVQLVTKSEFGKLIEGFVKEELAEDLTPASQETLAIVLYLGPVTRSRIDYLRGVNSVFTLRNLSIRGLIERMPDPERAGSFRYAPSFELLRHLGVERSDELPEYERFRERFLKSIETAPTTDS